jgi:hypothetical protein
MPSPIEAGMAKYQQPQILQERPELDHMGSLKEGIGASRRAASLRQFRGQINVQINYVTCQVIS